MTLPISDFLINQLHKDYNEILQILTKKEYTFDDFPESTEAKKDWGEAISLAYPIQGILKYHGFANSKNNIAYFPSISLNNSCFFTVSYLKLDKELKKDKVFLNGTQEFGSNFERVEKALDFIRNYSNIKTKALLISRNIYNSEEAGKGLGTSASGSAALALAAISIIYDNHPSYISNNRLISIFARYLSGSGCRSATGGFSLWLSHPRIDPLNSFAIRLDKKQHQKFIDKISLLTIPIKSEIKTSQAHSIAPKSIFFKSWLKKRKELVLEFIDALDSNDLNKIGELAEYDTLCLHAVAMTAPNNQNLIAWNPDTLKTMLKVRELRTSGYEVYYSIDTGPSLVLLTNKSNAKVIYKEIKMTLPNHAILEGNLGGPCRLLDSNSPEAKFLKEDIIKFNNIQNEMKIEN